MYCEKCGEKLVKRDIDGFDIFTGERHIRWVCPTGKCGHPGKKHDMVYRKFLGFIPYLTGEMYYKVCGAQGGDGG